MLISPREPVGVWAILGSAITIARHLALEMATFSRFLSNMKPSPRKPYSPKLVQSDRMHTAASCPWNLSTLPTRAPTGNIDLSDRTYAL